MLKDILGKLPDEHFMARFWSKVDVGESDECWEWTAFINYKGYGQFQVKKSVPRIAHRVAYALVVEDHFTNKDLICHTCDNRKCCNPKHLYKGTPLSNMQDMINKGRAKHPPMSGIGSSKISAQDARYIQHMYKQVPTEQLASQFNLCVEHVRRIGRKQSWLNIKDCTIVHEF